MLIVLLPGGPKSALGSAIACGILLGVFEGVGVLISRVFSEGNRPQLAPRTFSYLPHCPISPLFFSPCSHDIRTIRVSTLRHSVDIHIHLPFLPAPASS